MADQVWVQFSCVIGVVIGFCYIPPSDSPYFNHLSFSAIQEKIRSFDNDKKFVIIGDLNSRFGSSVRNLPIKSEIPDSHLYTYPAIPDDVPVANDNAYVLGTICSDNDLLVVNNLSTPSNFFRGGKTFKKKNLWISELDICLVSFSLLVDIDNFKIHQTDFFAVGSRSHQLRGYFTWHGHEPLVPACRTAETTLATGNSEN